LVEEVATNQRYDIELETLMFFRTVIVDMEN